MAAIRQNRWDRGTSAHVSLGAAVLLLGLVGTHAVDGLLPACPIFQMLRVRCPGCGSTRALGALLRGHWAEAWGWNPLFVAVLPAIVGYGVTAYARALGFGRWQMPRVRPWSVAAGPAVITGFTFARNGW